MSYFGRHKAIVITESFLTLGGLLTLPLNIPCMMAGRFIQGITGCGMISVIAPRYIEEISPDHLRGSLGSFS